MYNVVTITYELYQDTNQSFPFILLLKELDLVRFITEFRGPCVILMFIKKYYVNNERESFTYDD